MAADSVMSILLCLFVITVTSVSSFCVHFRLITDNDKLCDVFLCVHVYGGSATASEGCKKGTFVRQLIQTLPFYCVCCNKSYVGALLLCCNIILYTKLIFSNNNL